MLSVIESLPCSAGYHGRYRHGRPWIRCPRRRRPNQVPVASTGYAPRVADVRERRSLCPGAYCSSVASLWSRHGLDRAAVFIRLPFCQRYYIFFPFMSFHGARLFSELHVWFRAVSMKRFFPLRNVRELVRADKKKVAARLFVNWTLAIKNVRGDLYTVKRRVFEKLVSRAVSIFVRKICSALKRPFLGLNRSRERRSFLNTRDDLLQPILKQRGRTLVDLLRT